MLKFIIQVHLKTPSPGAPLYPIHYNLFPFPVAPMGPDSCLQFWEGYLKIYFQLPVLPQECYLRNGLHAGKCCTTQLLLSN